MGVRPQGDEPVANLLREAGVSRFVFLGRCRPVHARQMKDHVGPAQPVAKLLLGQSKVVLVQIDILAQPQRLDEIPADESARTGDEDDHGRHPFNSALT